MRYLLLLVSCVVWGQAWFPSLPTQQQTGISATNLTIDAANEKIAFCGFVWTPGAVSKSIRNVGIRTGSTITKSGGSGLTVSLQDISTSAGVPIQPDGTQDQTVAINNASIPAVSTWYVTGNLSADRSVSHGDPLCVVTEFDGSGWQASDVITLSGLAFDSTNPTGLATTTTFASAAWGAFNRQPLLFFVFSDGTYGTLDGALPVGPSAATSYASNTAGADEYALQFVAPFTGYVDGVQYSGNGSGDFEIVMYSGTTALTTKAMEANWYGGMQAGKPTFIAFPKTNVTAGSTYYVSIKPTTTTALTLVSWPVANAAYLDALPQGQTWHRAKRLDAGSWTAETTERPAIFVRLTQSGGGSSAGGAYVVAQ